MYEDVPELPFGKFYVRCRLLQPFPFRIISAIVGETFDRLV